MDRLGRKYAIIISLIILSVGISTIAFSNSFQTMLLSALIIGFGNGIGSGTMLTLGADLAPIETRGEFLGTWLLIGNIGSMSGPLLVGGIASFLILNQASLILAGSGFLGIFTFLVFVPETLKRKRLFKEEDSH
jgi:MFS family permease